MTKPETVTLAGQLFHRVGADLFPDYLNHGNAREFIQHVAERHCQGSGIDIGADRWPFPGATPIRNEPGANAYRLDAIADGSLNYVFSSHCLEHLDRPAEAIALWVTKLRPGGVLFLYLPHPDMTLWNPGGAWVGDGHKWMPTEPAVGQMMEAVGLDLIEAGDRDVYWSFHVVGRKP